MMVGRQEETQFMDEEKQKLQKELENLRREIQQLGQRLASKPDYGFGRGDPAIYEWEMTLARQETLKDRVRRIEGILRKMEEGRYGVCERCGQPIDPERLEVLPHTTLCIKCAQARR
jgi:DnaK suppressor protein